MQVNAIIAIAAAVCVLTGLGAGIGICFATSKASEAIARQPEAADKILRVTLLGTGLAEATAVYGLIVAIILLVLNWT